MKITAFLLIAFYSLTLKAELICNEGDGFQSCSQQQVAEPQKCAEEPHPILQSTGQAMQPMICDNQEVIGSSEKDDVEDRRHEYEKLCKKKAKAYKKALMKNLMSKGKVGQWMQVLFHKKKFKAKDEGLKSKDKNQLIDIDPAKFAGMKPEEVENYLLDEIEKNLVKDYPHMKGLKERSKQLAQDPSFAKSYDEPETVPLNLMVKTKNKNSCKVDVPEQPKAVSYTPKDCRFCEEKNIASSFTNDCSYMVGKELPENAALAMMGNESREQYCNHDMSGEQNDMKEVDELAKTLCDIATDKDNLNVQPEFLIETSRNLYRDKTPQLADKRGQFIQKYLFDKLSKQCPVDEKPEWLNSFDDFSKVVQRKSPEYVGAKEGDYGPSPYAAAGAEQDENIKNFEETLRLEKKKLEDKKTASQTEVTKISSDMKALDADLKKDKDLYTKLSAELSRVKVIDQALFDKKKNLEDLYNKISAAQEKRNLLLQQESDLKKELGGYEKRLSGIDQKNASRVSLLKEYYQEKNEKGSVDTKAWDEKLFNDFKMVRISGKLKPTPKVSPDEQRLPPSVKIALQAAVDIQDFTCVVEPIKTHKTTLNGVLKGVGKVGMALTLPVVAVGGLAVGLATSPVSWAASYMCSGCGDPGNVPPVLTFNPRFWSLKAPFKKETWRDAGEAMNGYISLGGRLDADFNKKSEVFDNELKDVREEELKRQGQQ